MKKNYYSMFFLLVACIICFTSYSCDKEKVNDREDSYVGNDDDTPTDDSRQSIEIQKIVNDNVTAQVKYEYYTFSLDLYTYLTDAGKYFAGRSDIKYGIEWYYASGDGTSGSYTLDPNNIFMRVTMVTTNHYTVVIPVFVWDFDLDKTTDMQFFSFLYRSLKLKEERGEKLREDELATLPRLEPMLRPYSYMVDAYRGKVYAEIDGKRYYVLSFKK